jgi:hypothetical protein
MKLNTKRLAKIITLAITSLLIATASAEVYKYLYIDGSITVGSAQMVWILGDDAPGDGSISGSTATIDLDVEQGTPVNFTEVLFLKNDGSVTYNYNITLSTVVAGADFDEAKMHIYENDTTPGTWTYLDTIDLTNSADYYASTLAAGNYTRMSFEVAATASASGVKPFDVQVEYNE